MLNYNRTAIVSIIALSLTVLAGKILCQTRSQGPRFGNIDNLKRWINLPEEERRKAQEEDRFQRIQERLKRAEPENIRREVEAWSRLLKVTKEQWKRFAPVYDKMNIILREKDRGACGWGGGVSVGTWQSTSEFEWAKYSKTTLEVAPTLDEMTEGQKVSEELIDLLADDSTSDQVIREKIDALQLARAKARQEYPQVKQALHSILTTRRQEAVFLLFGLID